MRFLVELIATLLIALALGLASAWYMVDAPRIGAAVGAWKIVPAISADTADPYTRARIARTGEIAVGAGEGLVFIATEDDRGNGLDGACDWRVSGDTPSARLWTLTVTDARGGLAASPSGRLAMTSRDVLRDAAGRFEVAVSATARPGNWLPAPEKGPLRFVLRLYDTPLALSPGAAAVPRITRGDCR